MLVVLLVVLGVRLVCCRQVVLLSIPCSCGSSYGSGASLRSRDILRVCFEQQREPKTREVVRMRGFSGWLRSQTPNVVEQHQPMQSQVSQRSGQVGPGENTDGLAAVPKGSPVSYQPGGLLGPLSPPPQSSPPVGSSLPSDLPPAPKHIPLEACLPKSMPPMSSMQSSEQFVAEMCGGCGAFGNGGAVPKMPSFVGNFSAGIPASCGGPPAQGQQATQPSVFPGGCQGPYQGPINPFWSCAGGKGGPQNPVFHPPMVPPPPPYPSNPETTQLLTMMSQMIQNQQLQMRRCNPNNK